MCLATLLIGFFIATSAPAKLPDFTSIAEKAGKAVVNISTVKLVDPSQGMAQGRQNPMEEFFERFFGGIPKPRKQRSLGSGFIISADGTIVTNYHVIANAQEIKVNLQNREESFDAEVMGKDPATDLALLRIEAEDLPVLEMGDSENIQPGEWVVAIGNPFGLKHTVTSGIISAKGRVIGAGPYDDFLQTDASINPGNSGGPLLNMDGDVVGINTAIVAAGEGIGFAVPTSMAREVIAQLKKYQRVKRGWLGITVQDVTREVARALDLQEPRGGLVASVQPGGPAARAGLTSGDVILEVNGQPVEDGSELTRTIGRLEPGAEASLTVWRKGAQQTFEVTLGDRGKQTQAGQPSIEQDKEQEAKLGVKLKPLTEREARALGLESAEGLLVAGVMPDSLAARHGIKPGDVILKANGRSTTSVETFRDVVLEAMDTKGVLMLHINRRGTKLFVTIPMEDGKS
jgi:serine protease Do